MQGWERECVPALAFRPGVYVVGSQAELYSRGLPPDPEKDWDLLVEHTSWRSIAMSIPKTARPNGNRGWRFEKDGLKVDAWPDTLSRFLDEATSLHRIRAKPGPAYVVCLSSCLVIRAERTL